MILPPAAVISGHSAACVHGAGFVEADAPVEVTLDRDVRPRAGIAVRRSELRVSDIVVLNGLRVTSPARPNGCPGGGGTDQCSVSGVIRA